VKQITQHLKRENSLALTAIAYVVLVFLQCSLFDIQLLAVSGLDGRLEVSLGSTTKTDMRTGRRLWDVRLLYQDCIRLDRFGIILFLYRH